MTISAGACLAVGLGIYVLVVAAVDLTPPSIIFRTEGLTARPPSTFPIEWVTFKTSDGLMLNGGWLESASPTRSLRCFHL